MFSVSSGAPEPEAGPKGQPLQNPDPLLREGHPLPPPRAHRLEVPGLQGLPAQAEEGDREEELGDRGAAQV